MCFSRSCPKSTPHPEELPLVIPRRGALAAGKSLLLGPSLQWGTSQHPSLPGRDRTLCARAPRPHLQPRGISCILASFPPPGG